MRELRRRHARDPSVSRASQPDLDLVSLEKIRVIGSLLNLPHDNPGMPLHQLKEGPIPDESTVRQKVVSAKMPSPAFFHA
jgi:hypothetical protein